MMRFHFILLCLLFFCFEATGKTDTLRLKRTFFDQSHRIPLAVLDNWLFKKGYDPARALLETNVSTWIPMKPADISPNMADERGRIEGWFRTTIIIDSSMAGLALGISRELWAATDIYLDGLLIQSFGNTGPHYEAYNPTLKKSYPLNMLPGKAHVLAVHFVDYETTFTPRELRLTPHNLQYLINLTDTGYNERIELKRKQTYLFGAMTISVSCILLLLFLLLLFLNQGEKIFQLSALLTCTVFVAAIGSYYSLIYPTSYSVEKILFLITNGGSLPIMHALTLLITEWVLKRKLSWITFFILMAMPVTSALGHVFNISWPFGLVEIILLSYFFYLVWSQWKTIQKTEWVVVIAMMTLTIGSLVWVFLHKYYPDEFYDYEYPLKTMVILSAPILLLVYVSLSYKRILAERDEQSQRVIKVTAEKQKLLEEQNIILETQVAQRTRDLEKSLKDLKSTQAQLIQSEKMASLGELTAGIAHEIQNPLNFVNNFSDVNTELAVELEQAIDKGNYTDAKAIAKDIKDNEEKINHHGKRADGIVKSMLLHTQKSLGQKELTDINALCDEYLRLAYHGLKAKDKSFNAKFETDFDSSLPKVSVVPQDIGRVILNLINNAFYAVNERSKKGETGYEPTVSVTTKLMANSQLQIAIKDNGPGIPDAIKDKIFQPFFTTKPTGQGTGLGLSLSYDIVNAHGGALQVKTMEGNGTKFIIALPWNNP